MTLLSPAALPGLGESLSAQHTGQLGAARRVALFQAVTAANVLDGHSSWVSQDVADVHAATLAESLNKDGTAYKT